MKAQHVLYTWDYHHGQATRVIVGGLPPLRGATMAEKQAYFQEHCDRFRTSLLHEPRGHRNTCACATSAGMLGAVITDPATPDGDVGLLFLSPQGYFEMCGDSTFSGVAALVDAGIVRCEHPDGEMTLKVDTVAGRLDVHVALKDGEPAAITFNNVASYDLGAQTLEVAGVGPVEARLGYGGLTYAFVEARAAVEAAAGRLKAGETFVHESPLGLRFVARVVETNVSRADGGTPGVVPAATARSFLMGTAQWVLHPEDPFRYGFAF
jgi:proline racemase